MVYLLAIFGMVCWGIAPIFAKFGLNNANPMAALVLRTLMAAGMVTAWIGISGSLDQVKPVSYTHLDVYKRQYLNSAKWKLSGIIPNCPIVLTELMTDYIRWVPAP